MINKVLIENYNPIEEQISNLRFKVEEETTNRIKSPNKNLLLQLYNSNTIIAECYTKQYLNSFHIFLIHVLANHRRQGYGRMLINKLKEIGKTRHIDFITLNTILNKTAKSFYLKVGFELEFERYGYSSEETCCYFIKKL